MNEKETVQDRIGRFAALQSLAEVGVGSLVHALHVPFGGHFLSLNQALLLVFAARGCRGRRDAVSVASGVSGTAAVLKALSPAGKRLTPMLAISVQGLLFSSGLAVFGANTLGAALGAGLLSLWGFAQPLLIAFILFGKTFFDAVVKLWTETAASAGLGPEMGLWILVAVAALKFAVAVGISAGAWRSEGSVEAKYLGKIEGWSQNALSRARPPSRTRAGVAAFGDLLTPWFLVSAGLSVGFFVLSQRPEAGPAVLYVLRVVAMGWLFFFLLRKVPRAWAARMLSRFPRIQQAANQVFRERSRT